MHAPRFGTQSIQSSKQPYYNERWRKSYDFLFLFLFNNKILKVLSLYPKADLRWPESLFLNKKRRQKVVSFSTGNQTIALSIDARLSGDMTHL